MVTDRSDLKRELKALQASAGMSYSYLARRAEKANIAGLSKSTIRRVFVEGTLPRWRESFEALLRILGVDDDRVESYWRKIWTQYAFSGDEEVGSIFESDEDEHGVAGDVGRDAPDPLMSPDEVEWMERQVDEEGLDSDLVPARLEAQLVGIQYESDWPYGDDDEEMQDRLIAWARAHHLELETGRVCLEWLKDGICPHSYHRLRSWKDHVTGWTRRGEPAVLVSQPYGLRGEALAELARIHDSGYPVVVDGTGWYGNGTTFVSIWRDSPRRQ